MRVIFNIFYIHQVIKLLLIFFLIANNKLYGIFDNNNKNTDQIKTKNKSYHTSKTKTDIQTIPSTQFKEVDTNTKLNNQQKIHNSIKKSNILYSFFNIPIFLQITRSKFGNLQGNATIQTESFKETWILEHSINGKTILKSPHDTIEIFGINNVVGNEQVFPPSSILITVKDFVKLVGLKNLNITEEALNSMIEQNQYLTLNIFKNNEDLNHDFNINLSENEHIEIHLTINKS